MLADAYSNGAQQAGHEVRTLQIARIQFPLLRSQADWSGGPVAASIAAAQRDVTWADHLVVVFPLSLGGMLALLKAFFEQVMRPGFAVGQNLSASARLLRGRSARVVVTMGMPALVYRVYLGAHGLRVLQRNILGFVGFSPVRANIVGSVERMKAARRQRLRAKLEALGRAAR